MFIIIRNIRKDKEQDRCVIQTRVETPEPSKEPTPHSHRLRRVAL